MLQNLNIKENVSIRGLNTFHIDSTARYFIEVNNYEQLSELIKSEFLDKNSILLLGGGSNLLFTNNFKGIVVQIRNKGIEVYENTGNSVLVKVAAGENWHEFVSYCVGKGFGGLENLSLIPGNVGSCPIQNIGAYGVEVKDSFYSLEAVDLKTGELNIFHYPECNFGYRDSIFKGELKGKFAIWSVTFQLNLNPVVHVEYGAIKQELEAKGIENPGIRDVSEAVCAIRQSKLPDPEILGNAGSFFKNPTVDLKFADKLRESFPKLVSYTLADGNEKLAAGWLIEQCGWKGFREGDAGVHQNQALVLVNYGNASGSQILTLAHKVQNSVYERFGVKLEMEVNVI
ncbi:MAG: UDP-N-acetylmuramate dehydrogenase [Bacteroidales bacterium]